MTTDRRPFGFTVIRELADRISPPATDDEWRVYLPHQCSSWDIAGTGYGEPEPHAAAVAELEQFIVEAQAALEALRDRREVDPFGHFAVADIAPGIPGRGSVWPS